MDPVGFPRNFVGEVLHSFIIHSTFFPRRSETVLFIQGDLFMSLDNSFGSEEKADWQEQKYCAVNEKQELISKVDDYIFNTPIFFVPGEIENLKMLMNGFIFS